MPIWQQHIALARAKSSAIVAQQALRTPPPFPRKVAIYDDPTRIVIPSVGIDLPVERGAYDFSSKVWSVSNATANYAENTVKINDEKGRTLIYGHWTRRVFGPTRNLNPSDEVYVYTAHSHIFMYRFDHAEVIRPTDTSVLRQFSEQKGLVLMTCTGIAAQDRRLMYFNLEQVR